MPSTKRRQLDIAEDERRYEREWACHAINRERHKHRFGRSIVQQVKRDITMCHSYGVEGSKHAVY